MQIDAQTSIGRTLMCLLVINMVAALAGAGAATVNLMTEKETQRRVAELEAKVQALSVERALK